MASVMRRVGCLVAGLVLVVFASAAPARAASFTDPDARIFTTTADTQDACAVARRRNPDAQPTAALAAPKDAEVAISAVLLRKAVWAAPYS